MLHILLSAAFLAAPPNQEPPMNGELFKTAIRSWENWLAVIPKIGDDEGRIEKLMQGKYRDKAPAAMGGSGAKRVYYLIDDYLQVYFAFDRNGKLHVSPTVEKKGKWLKLAEGGLYGFPGPFSPAGETDKPK